MSESVISPVHIGELVRITEEGIITRQIGKEVWAEMSKSGLMPSTIVQEKGLAQEPGGDDGLQTLIAEIVADPKHAKAISQFREGNAKALNSLVGPVMKATQGKANPAEIQKLLRQALV